MISAATYSPPVRRIRRQLSRQYRLHHRLERPHLQNYLDSIKATGIARMGITDASGASFLKATGFETFRAPAAMLDQLKPGLTIVSMEAHHAPPAIRLALEKGSHVLAEKPACVTLSDFEALVALAKRNNKHLMLAFAKRMRSAGHQGARVDQRRLSEG